jgi:hypothetical protein
MACPRFLFKLDCLTPGDFAVVARKADVLGERDVGRLTEMLAEEVEARPDGQRQRKIGF